MTVAAQVLGSNARLILIVGVELLQVAVILTVLIRT